MAFHVRRAAVRNGAMVAGLSLVAALVVGVVMRSGLSVEGIGLGFLRLTPADFVGPALFAIAAGAWTSFTVLSTIKDGVLRAMPRLFAYTELTRGQQVQGVNLDWEAVDDYGIQLEARGFRCLGYFSTVPLPKHFVGVAACFVDQDASTLVEIQFIQIKDAMIAATRSNPGGVHVSIATCLGGNIAVSTTDHQVQVSNYLIAGDHSAVASFPGLSLLELLHKHARLVSHLEEKCGKTPTPGLTIPRYVYLHRERFQAARARIQAMSGYQIAKAVDAFEAAPRTQWTTPPQVLAALPVRSFIELDNSEFAVGQVAAVVSYGDALTLG